MPSIPEIADEINRRAQGHLIGTLQDIRTELKGFQRRPGSAIFSAQTVQPAWAFHHGGRKELQFNIGLEDAPGVAELRHGVGFSLEPSQTLPDIAPLLPKVRLFNEYLELYPDLFADMLMWHFDRDERSADYAPAPIPAELAVPGVFVFLGKRQPLADVDYDLILDDFDRLVPLYRYVESEGRDEPVATPTTAGFTFRAGFSQRKPSAVAKLAPRELNIQLRHNELQKALYEQLTRTHGADNVSAEQDSGVGTFVDMVVRRPGDRFWFYEIKTAQAARACIREALGQLLEYSHWPGSPVVDRMVVVGEGVLDKEAEAYLQNLQDCFALPVSYERVVAVQAV